MALVLRHGGPLSRKDNRQCWTVERSSLGLRDDGFGHIQASHPDKSNCYAKLDFGLKTSYLQYSADMACH